MAKILKSESVEKQRLIDEKTLILNDLLYVALLENKSDMVNLLLKLGINLDKFLDQERLKRLYNNEAVCKTFTKNLTKAN